MHEILSLVPSLQGAPDPRSANLVSLLSAPDWAVRADAQHKLGHIRPFLYRYLTLVSQQHPCSEARYRCSQLVKRYERRTLGGDRWPWIWMGNYEPREGTELGYWLCQVSGRDDAEDYPRWRTASYLWAMDQLRAGRPQSEVRQRLGVMLMRESKWRWDTRSRH